MIYGCISQVSSGLQSYNIIFIFNVCGPKIDFTMGKFAAGRLRKSELAIQQYYYCC